jgi:hypothetical protein
VLHERQLNRALLQRRYNPSLNLPRCVSLADFLTGCALFTVTWGSLLASAEIAVRRRAGHLSGAARAAAVGVVFSGGLIGIHVLAGALTILSRWVVAAGALAVVGAVWRLVPYTRSGDRESPTRVPPTGVLSGALGAVALTAFAAYSLYFLKRNYSTPLLSIDALSFHLPGAVRWMQAGSIWQINEFLPRFPTGAYPNNGDAVSLALMLPWHSDAFVRLAEVPWLALTGVAMYAIAIELRVSRGTALLFAAMVLAVRAVTSFALDQFDPDTFLLATFGCAALFLVRNLRHRDRAESTLAGVGLGLAFGTTWYGIPATVALLAVWGAVSLLRRTRAAAVARQALLISAVGLLFGGVWLLRNWVLTGDPFYPGRIAFFRPPVDLYLRLYGYSLFDRIGQPGVWGHYVLPDLREAIGGPGIVLLIGLLAVVVALVRRRRALWELPESAALLLTCASILIAVFYVLTPATAQGTKAAPFPGLVGGNSRALIPALVLAAPAVAWVTSRLGRWGSLFELAALGATLDGLEQTFSFPVGGLVLFGLEVALTLLVLLVGIAWLRSRPRAARGGVTVAAVLVLAIVLAAIGERAQRHFYRYRYVGTDTAVAWVITHAPRGNRIGVAGDWTSGALPSPVLPLFGPRFRNQVAYVGRMDVGTLVRFSRESSFLSAVRRGGYDLLLVGTAPSPFGPPVAPTWARATGFRPVASSYRFILFASPSFLASSRFRESSA